MLFTNILTVRKRLGVKSEERRMKTYEMKGTVMIYSRAENEDEAIRKFEERMREAFAYLMVDSNLEIKEVKA